MSSKPQAPQAKVEPVPKEYEEPEVDQYLSGGNRDQKAEQAHQEEVVFEMRQNEMSSARDREMDLLKQQIAELRAMIEHEAPQRGVLADGAEVSEFVRQQRNRALWDEMAAKLDPTRCKRLITIILHESDNPELNGPVFISLNEEARYLRRGIPVKVSIAELEILENAVYDVFEPVPEPDPNDPKVSRKKRVTKRTYPYHMIDDGLAGRVLERRAA